MSSTESFYSACYKVKYWNQLLSFYFFLFFSVGGDHRNGLNVCKEHPHEYHINPGPAEPWYALPLQMVASDLGQHCLLRPVCQPQMWKAVEYSSVILNCVNGGSLYLFPLCGDFDPLLITFANSLDPDEARQNVGPDLDPNCLTLWRYSRKIFLKKLI